MTDKMTPEEIINLAYSEFDTGMSFDDTLKIKISSDDGGQILEFFVEGKENATALREEVPPKYNGFRTVIVFREINAQ